MLCDVNPYFFKIHFFIIKPSKYKKAIPTIINNGIVENSTPHPHLIPTKAQLRKPPKLDDNKNKIINNSTLLSVDMSLIKNGTIPKIIKKIKEGNPKLTISSVTTIPFI